MVNMIKCLARSAKRLHAVWTTFDIVSAYKHLGWHLEQPGWLGPMILAEPLARNFERCVSHERLRQVPVCAPLAPNFAAAASARRLDCADYPRLMLAKPDADR